jgi:hypothetical protein
MQTWPYLLVAALVVAGSASAEPLSDFAQQCVRPLVEQRCVLADADAAGLREQPALLSPVAGTIAFRLKGGAQLLFSGLEPYRCHVLAPQMRSLPALPVAPAAVALSAKPAPGGRGWLLTAEIATELAAPMAR